MKIKESLFIFTNLNNKTTHENTTRSIKMTYGMFKLHNLKPGQEKVFLYGQACMKSLIRMVREQEHPEDFIITENIHGKKFIVERKWRP